MSENSQISLFGTEGVDSLQKNGFRRTANAVAEIVDNSIQARSENVQIILRSKNEGGYQRVKDVLIIDDGDGMNLPLFRQALSFQSGTNFGANRGLGRYGMGLPNSSVSQTRRFEVYTWQKENGKKIIYHNFLDLDVIKASKQPFLQEPKQVESPFKDRLLELANIDKIEKGTVVIWKNCNQLKPKTTKSLVDHLNRHLGRMFRYYINGFNDGEKEFKVNLSIRVYDDNGQEFDEIKSQSILSIKPFDPLFLMKGSQTAEIFPDPEFNGATSELFAEIDEEFIVDGVKHPIRIIFTKFKKAVRNKIKGQPGSSKLGQLYLYRNNSRKKPYANISIMRANREIDARQYGFLGDVSDNRQRFWSIEVHCEAISDEIFGIDSTKQNASNFRNYNLESDLSLEDLDESEAILYKISEYITSNKEQIMGELKKDGKGTRGGGNKDDDGEDDGNPFEPDGEVDSEEDSGDEVTDQDRIDAKIWILNRYPEEFRNNPELLEKNVDWFLGLPCKHYIVYSDLGDIELYSFKTFGDKTLIEININHQFYDRFIRIIEEEENDERRNIIWFLFSSMVMNEKRYLGTPEENILRRLRANLATNLTDLMYKWYDIS